MMNGVGCLTRTLRPRADSQPARLASYQQRHSSETDSTTVLGAVSVQFRPMLRFTELPFRDWTVQTNSTRLPNP